MATHPQRYRLTFEFVLRDPKDFSVVAAAMRRDLDEYEDNTVGIINDFIAFEKVKDDTTKKKRSAKRRPGKEPK